METHGEYHIGKVLAAVRRLHNAWGGSRIQANFKLIGSGGLESVHKIAIIEAYLKPVAAALAGADVLGLADGRGAGAFYGAVAEDHADWAAVLLAYDQRDAVYGGHHLAALDREWICGN